RLSFAFFATSLAFASGGFGEASVRSSSAATAVGVATTDGWVFGGAQAAGSFRSGSRPFSAVTIFSVASGVGSISIGSGIRGGGGTRPGGGGGGGGRARRPLHPRLDPKRSRRQRQRRRIEGTEERVLRLDVGEDPARRKVAVPGGHATGERSPSRRRRTCGDDERRHDDDRLRRPRLVLASRLPRRDPLRREEHGYGPGSAGPG